MICRYSRKVIKKRRSEPYPFTVFAERRRWTVRYCRKESRLSVRGDVFRVGVRIWQRGIKKSPAVLKDQQGLTN
jgi:hypothetical protein